MTFSQREQIGYIFPHGSGPSWGGNYPSLCSFHVYLFLLFSLSLSYGINTHFVPLIPFRTLTVQDFWAPEIHIIQNRFVVYYVARDKAGKLMPTCSTVLYSFSLSSLSSPRSSLFLFLSFPLLSSLSYSNSCIQACFALVLRTLTRSLGPTRTLDVP